MFFDIIFLLCIGIGSANDYFYNNSTSKYFFSDDLEKLSRSPRRILTPPPKGEFQPEKFTCNDLYKTARHPFVVLMLYKTSGRFIGVGSIISKKTVLSAKRVVEKAWGKPYNLLALAGRMVPWWGRGSQVRHARNIFVNQLDLAIIEVDEEFYYNNNILPIKIAQYPATKSVGEFTSKWGSDCAVFGIPRNVWNRPGEPVEKSYSYVMEMEKVLGALDKCVEAFPDIETNQSMMFCSEANWKYYWGILGSPSVTLFGGKILQVGIIIATAYKEEDNYHLQVKIAQYELWIKSHTLLPIEKVQGRS